MVRADRELSDALLKELLDRQRRSATMAFDYKKEYKALYQPPCTPHLITVPSMTFALRNRISNMGMLPHMPRNPRGVFRAGGLCKGIRLKAGLR